MKRRCLRAAFAVALTSAVAHAQTGGTPPNPAGAEAAPAPGAGSPPSTEHDSEVDLARQAFVLGTALAHQGQWPEALDAFERSSALRPHPVTTYNVAYCERALGHYTRAYRLFRRSLMEHRAATMGTLPDDLFALAKAYLGEVEHRMARVAVRITVPDAALSVDGAPLELESAPGAARLVLAAGTRDDRGGEAPTAPSFDLLIDPGRHVFVLSRPSAPDIVVSESFEAGTSRELVLGPSPEPPSKPEQKPLTLRAPPPDHGTSHTAAWVAFGVGGAGLVTGSVFGILTMQKGSFLSAHCGANKVCDPKYSADVDTAHRDAAIATVGLGVALVGGGLGTYLLLSGNHEKAKERAPAVSIEPLVGPTLIGARGRF
jgi:tetratricopeptide (TPR) repeat protein